MSNIPSLLPCPFCGSAAHFESDSDGWHWVECESCGMQGNRGASLMEDCKPKLAEEWNRRTPQPVVREPLTPSQYNIALGCATDILPSRYEAVTRAIERAHGITQKGGD